jgi:phospholipid transport system substrate-binding protein
MSNLLRKLPVLAALALSFTLSLPAFAGAASDALKTKHTALTDLVSRPKTAESERKIDEVFDEVFDYDSLAKATLKDSWDDRSPAERSDFSALLKELVRNAYRRNIKKTLGYGVEYVSELDGEAGKVVHTVATNSHNKREDPVNIDYVLHQVNGTWRIADIVTEGSSLVRNYRNQFRKVIQKHSFEELLKRMKAKRDKGGDVD